MKYIAVLLLIGFVSIMFCGFIVTSHSMSHAQGMEHTDFALHHLALYQEFYTAPFIAAGLALVIAIFAFVSACGIALRTLSFDLRPQHAAHAVSIDYQAGIHKPPEIVRWLALFVHSPSIA